MQTVCSRVSLLHGVTQLTHYRSVLVVSVSDFIVGLGRALHAQNGSMELCFPLWVRPQSATIFGAAPCG
jgi:hypothetical protein